MHQAIVELYPAKKVEFENYYRNLLNTVFSQYNSEVASAASVTVSLINHHVPIRTSDKEYVNKVLFLESEHIIRCWMNLNFCHAGRASEVILYIMQHCIIRECTYLFLLCCYSVMNFLGQYLECTVIHLLMTIQQSVEIGVLTVCGLDRKRPRRLSMSSYHIDRSGFCVPFML